MITVLGPEDTREYKAALYLRRLIIGEWPELGQNKYDNITIIAAVKCYGQEREDIDLVVLGNLGQYRFIRDGNNQSTEVGIGSFCLTIEVKDHLARGVRFRGNQLEVRYKQDWHNVSEQSWGQLYSLRNYLQHNAVKPPYIVNLIWLRHIPESHLPDTKPHNFLGGDATWNVFLRQLVANQRQRSNPHNQQYALNIGRTNDQRIIPALQVLTRSLAPSPLDRKRMERVTRELLADQKYASKLGEQLLIFRGRGGTGKTVSLLRLAYQLYDQYDSRVLILTYNKALMADMRRLLSLLGIRNDIAERSVAIVGIHAFLYKVLYGLAVLPDHCSDFLDNYEWYKNEGLNYLQDLQPGEIRSFVLDSSGDYNWDYIFIDESQDWPANERDILFRLYDYSKFVLADGKDQFVRSRRPIDWRANIDRTRSQVVPLTRSLRLKSGLCSFVRSFAENFGFDDWDVEPNLDVYGGRVVVLEGDYVKAQSFHDELLTDLVENGNYPIDMLFCVPPKLAAGRKGAFGPEMSKYGFQVWDGTDNRVRDGYPTSLEQLRVVQYDSCRGLEAWTVVCLGFDDFFDWKTREYDPIGEERDLYFDRKKAAQDYAKRWLMIPLTRAIDTLVLQISPGEHYISKVLRSIARKHSDIVDWRKYDL